MSQDIFSIDDLLRLYGRDAAKLWCVHLWSTGFAHGTELAEALGTPHGRWVSGDPDNVASADRILRAMESAGWLIKGTYAPTLTRRAWEAPGGVRNNSPVDYGYQPNRLSSGLRYYVNTPLPT